MLKYSDSPLGTSRCRRKLTSLRISTKKKNKNNDDVPNIYSVRQKSRQTTRTFTFKIEVQIPSTCPSAATCAPTLRAINALGVYHTAVHESQRALTTSMEGISTRLDTVAETKPPPQEFVDVGCCAQLAQSLGFRMFLVCSHN